MGFINWIFMLLYRVGQTSYADKLNGEGSFVSGGRWNHPGNPCIYTSESRALSLLEYACHSKKEKILRDLSFITYEVPDNSIKKFKIGQLPGNWKYYPYANDSRDFGTKFLCENEFLIYGIPSAIIEEEMNYIINPNHPDISRIRILETRDYAFDLRVKTN
jgi:RES domain-containing protein